MSRLTIALALFLTAALAAPAYADGHMEAPAPKPGGADELPPQTEFFDEYDANADGAVSRDEYPHSAESFRLLDKDEDGKITTTELGLPADYRPDPKAKKRRAEIRAREERGDGLAGARGDRMRKLFEKMDKNGDKAISRDEWTGRPDVFDRVDRNKDGVLDAKDMQRSDRARGMDPAKAFASLDKNGDGKITEDEAPRPGLMRLDTDEDGAVSLDEFKVLAKRMRRAQNRNKDRRPRGVKAGQLKRFDANGDGQVTRDEFPGNDRQFKMLDLNGDGMLSEADIQKKAKKKKKDKAKDKPAVTTESGSLIQSHDSDGDGKLNRAEFKGSDEAWKQLDRNGDGWVTADEVGEAPKKQDP